MTEPAPVQTEPYLTLEEQRQNGRACYELAVKEMRKSLPVQTLTRLQERVPSGMVRRGAVCDSCRWHQDRYGNWYCPHGGPFSGYVNVIGVARLRLAEPSINASGQLQERA